MGDEAKAADGVEKKRGFIEAAGESSVIAL